MTATDGMTTTDDIGEPRAAAGATAGDADPAAAAAPGGGSEQAEADAEAGTGGRDGWARRLAGRFRSYGWRRPAGIAAVAVLLLGSGGLLYAAQDLKDPAATRNRALTDSATTDQVIGDVSSALSEIFAYTPDGTDATEQAARSVLAGGAATQYQALFAQIKQNVAAQQLTLTTRVVRAGVVTLTGDRARLLVFLDQTAQRAGSTATSAAAQLSVTAEQMNGRWRITALKAR
ncbi:nuclear transport factor 2 family protein [Actinacidiphila reveromycinica]|nr:nuclear transport factor 2 family protein [Streptomyces sp. SN-593]